MLFVPMAWPLLKGRGGSEKMRALLNVPPEPTKLKSCIETGIPFVVNMTVPGACPTGVPNSVPAAIGGSKSTHTSQDDCGVGQGVADGQGVVGGLGHPVKATVKAATSESKNALLAFMIFPSGLIKAVGGLEFNLDILSPYTVGEQIALCGEEYATFARARELDVNVLLSYEGPES